jgi:3-oxoacyl-[acyl-carrier protein] reductase
MELGLKDKVAMITGGTKGNGKATAFCFAAERCKIAFCDYTEDLLKPVTKEMKHKTGADVLAIKADVTKREEIDHFVEETLKKFGRIDILVNNAIGPPSPVESKWFPEMHDDEIRTGMERKFLPYARCARAVVLHMIKQGGGKIVNIAGNSGYINFGAGHMIMSYNNAAVMRLTTDLAANLAQYEILVNAINPGPVETERWKGLIKFWAAEKGVSEAEVSREHLNRVPLKKLAKPEDVASLAVFLASERANMITGTVINMDGGMTLRI